MSQGKSFNRILIPKLNDTILFQETLPANGYPLKLKVWLSLVEEVKYYGITEGIFE